MRRPIVTVVLATYNGERFLPEQLASLIAQSRRPDRLLLRDDGSTDHSVELVRAWAERNGVAFQQVAGPRLGPARSFLVALQAAEPADVFLFCDQDDVWLPHKIERAVATITSTDPALPHLMATRLQIVNDSLTPIRLSPMPHHLSFNSAVCESVLTGCTMALNDSLRMLLVRELPRQMAMHDWWCYLLASGTGQVSFDAEPSVMYRQHNQNSIGAEPVGLPGIRNKLARFFSKKESNIRSRQLMDFARLYGKDLRPDAADLLAKLTLANQSITGRWRAALTLQIKRQYIIDQITTRLSLLINRF